ncbi:OmpA family protein [Vibrio sp. EJY3]|uniref:OmpA family protein n=1 Tax=Vibrio sp. (strain EJY3) TaxID=1116375 RepID=UPI000243B8C0|nr:OmpA family protein [Vibrio sp. EJY3]AEX24924.1 outer membrane protein A [Vibrio sp. EJY3]
MKLTLPYLLVAVKVAMGSVAYAAEAPSSAEEMTDASVMASSAFPAYQNGHFYLGARMGWAAYQDACGSSANDCNDDTFGYGAYGGYQFNHWLALEGGVTAYGEPDASYPEGDLAAEVTGGEVAVKLSYPLTERVDVFTRLGGAYQSIDKSASMTTDSMNSHEWNTLASLGMSYRLSQRWSVRGEYQFIDGIGEDNDIGQADLHFTSIGLTYHFGQSEPEVVPVEPVPVVEPEPQYVTTTTTVSLSAGSLFDFDSSELTANAELASLAEQLTQYPEDKVRIVGHTDSAGPEAYNQRLSERRAQSVANYLEQQGVDRTRLTVSGAGESSPVASNETAEGRAQNRRVEVVFDTTVEETKAVNESSVAE